MNSSRNGAHINRGDNDMEALVTDQNTLRRVRSNRRRSIQTPSNQRRGVLTTRMQSNRRTRRLFSMTPINERIRASGVQERIISPPSFGNTFDRQSASQEPVDENRAKSRISHLFDTIRSLCEEPIYDHKVLQSILFSVSENIIPKEINTGDVDINTSKKRVEALLNVIEVYLPPIPPGSLKSGEISKDQLASDLIQKIIALTSRTT